MKTLSGRPRPGDDDARLVGGQVTALFGIANTLALSVFERPHEFGLLRAVRLSRGQVRSTVRGCGRWATIE